MTKLIGTTVINMTATVFKDVTLAKLFGNSVNVKCVPHSTYCIFLLRDTLAMAGGFTIPVFFSPKLESTYGVDK